MKLCLKILGYAIAAEFLSLFISLTLGFSGSVPMRFVCGFCTVGILLGLMGQAGFSCARSDKTVHPLLPGFVGVLPYLCGWTALFLSKLGILPDGFYRVYKILFAPFLSVCNLFSEDVVTSTLPWFGVWGLLGLSVLPGVAATVAYALTGRRPGTKRTNDA